MRGDQQMPVGHGDRAVGEEMGFLRLRPRFSSSLGAWAFVLLRASSDRHVDQRNRGDLRLSLPRRFPKRPGRRSTRRFIVGSFFTHFSMAVATAFSSFASMANSSRSLVVVIGNW